MKRVVSFAPLLFALACSQLCAQHGKKIWSIDEILASRKFTFKSLSSVQWVEGGRKFSYLETDTTTKQRNLYTYNVKNGKRELVMEGSSLSGTPGEKPMRLGSYSWSSDCSTILVTGTLPARRTKTGGNFGVFDVKTRTFRLLSDTAVDQEIIHFSPDGKKIGFVRANNIFVVDVATGNETQLTADGSDVILNGHFDWVYEEEFSIIDGWQWSPDSKRIAFWRLDQSQVPQFPLVRYPEDSPHAEVEMMRYPKAGDPNSIATIGIVEVETGKTVWLDLGATTDSYVPRIKWTHDPQILSVEKLNRGQDTLQFVLANVITGATRTIITETDSAWIDVDNDDPRFLGRSRQFLWTSWRDGFTHLYLYNLDGTLERQVTRGDWDVTNVVGIDEAERLVYFIATKESPVERHLYSIGLDGANLRRLTQEAGWHAVTLSPDAGGYLDTYSSATSPPKVRLCDKNGGTLVSLVHNTLDAMEGYPMGQHAFFSFTTADGLSLNGWMIKPADFDPSKKYPVLMHVYGVGRQTVMNQWGGWNYLWYLLLAQKGYLVVSVDGRATDGRGKSFRQASFRRLGIPETNDQIEAAKYLGTLPYVDASRIGIWGSSGGGYMTLMAMTYGADYFKAGIAVAAPSNWKWYDSIWSERYMDTPASNPEGYRQTSPLTHASKLKGSLLIVHGTVDDNVHWQNSIVMVNELIRQNKQFHTMFYPGRAHGIMGDNAGRHYYVMMTNFILENL